MVVWGGLATQTVPLAGIDLTADSRTVSEAAVLQYLSLLTSLKNSSKLLKGEDTRKSLEGQEPGERILRSDSESEKKGEQTHLLWKDHL